MDRLVLWAAWFAITAYLKTFVGAAKDRLEILMGYAHALPLCHTRAMALLLLVLALDVGNIVALWSTKATLGWMYFSLLAFDTAIVAVEGVKTLMHYGIHTLERVVAWEWRHEAPEPLSESEAWDGKGAFLYHMELAADVLTHTMTLLHYLHIWFLHGLSFHLVDAILFMDVGSIVMAMDRRFRDAYAKYRAASSDPDPLSSDPLDHSFPDADPASLVAAECAICLARMTA